MPLIFNEDLKMRLEHYLQNADKEKLRDRQIYIWGSRQAAIQTAMMLGEHKIDFIGFVDNDIKVKNKRIKGYYNKKIFHAKEILLNVNPSILFILTNRKYADLITKQIVRSNYTMDNILNLFVMTETLYIGNKCNLNCRFCGIHGEHKTINNIYDDMSVETAKTIIDRIALYQTGINIASLGESLVHKEFMQILLYAYQKFNEIIVISNGLAIDRHMADEILRIRFEDNRVLNISFSVTGFSTEIYNRFQGSGRLNGRLRSKIYDNINYFIGKRNIDKIPQKQLQISGSYILSANEDNYDDLKEYVNYWNDKLDAIGINPERCHSIDMIGPLGYQYKIDEKADFLCEYIHGKVIYCNGDVGVCCEVGLSEGNILGNIIYENPLQSIKDRHNTIKDNFMNGNIPEFCRTCFRRNSYMLGFSAGEFKCMLDSISFIKDFFKDKKKVLFYGLSSYQRTLYTIIKGEGIIDRECIVIIDNEAEGYFHNKRILRPTVDNLKDQDMVVFEEESFCSLDIDIINSLNSWVSYKDFV